MDDRNESCGMQASTKETTNPAKELRDRDETTAAPPIELEPQVC